MRAFVRRVRRVRKTSRRVDLGAFVRRVRKTSRRVDLGAFVRRVSVRVTLTLLTKAAPSGRNVEKFSLSILGSEKPIVLLLYQDAATLQRGYIGSFNIFEIN